MNAMTSFLRYLLLLTVKAVSMTFWHKDVHWVGEPLPGNRWKNIRVCTILNHTSLFEWVFAAVPPPSFFRDLAYHGIVPVAEKTLRRPWVGTFFSTVAAHVVPISRQRDHTWNAVLSKIDDEEAMMIILPEGRMMRADGLDKEGRPMTLKGGIADVLQAIPDGRMLLAYSGGLHHVQVPGQRFPRLFRTVRMNLEVVDIAAYRAARLAEGGEDGFRAAVVRDLTERRNRHCPATPESAPGLFLDH
jgi:1-acyl-sn-glycerol-3-phosphate acyltransferase